MNTTRRQHYVWKHYLRKWERDGTVAVLRKGKQRVFRTSVVNIAVMRDFYRLPVVSEDDEEFILRFIDSTCSASEMLKSLNRRWLETIAATSRLRRGLTRAGRLDPAIDTAIEQVEIQFEENMHGHVENGAIKLIDALDNGRPEIWGNDDDALKFIYFLALQYMRTKKIRDNVVGGFPDGPIRQAVARRLPFLRHILATNLSWSLFSERTEWRLRVLKPAGTTAFIASDQPTLNLLSPDTHNGMALYYPVSPEKAAILERNDNASVVGNDDDVLDDVVRTLNVQIYNFSHEQIFGTDGAYLEALAGVPRDGTILR